MARAPYALRFLAILALSGGCASVPKGPTPAEIAAMKAAAEASVRAGCYDCLLSARDTYTRLAEGKSRPLYVQALFETELLLALREKELAMDPSASFARAQALAPELPPAVDAARYLALVEAVPSDAMGLPAAEDQAFRRAHALFVPKVSAEMTWLETGALQPLVRQYLSISIDCKYRSRPGANGAPQRIGGPPLDVPADAAPLIAYRLATCDAINRSALEDVRKRVPAFVETSLFVARIEVGNAQRTGGARARPLLAEAYARFPTSSSITYLNGNFHQLVGLCRDALKFYDETIALRPLHENALLGRTVCLTFTEQYEDAKAAATHMIDLQLQNMYEGYYWRAWLFHHQKDLASARRDIDRAKQIAYTGNIHRLAGEIEFDQDDLDQSEKDFIDAKHASDGGSDCTSRWYLGLIANKRSRSTDAAANFEDAMSCYATAATYTESNLRQMQARTDIDPGFLARQVEGLTAAIKEDRSQQYASACNAANHYARLGNRDKALALLDIAARDPSLDKVIAELRRFIGGVF